VTGRDPKWSIDLLLDGGDSVDYTVPEYAREVRDRLAVANEVARQNLESAAQTAADWYDRTTKPTEFAVGDKVRLFCPRHFQGWSPKLQSNYAQTGVVQAKLNDSTYLVKTQRGTKAFHTDKLKLIWPCCPSS